MSLIKYADCPVLSIAENQKQFNKYASKFTYDPKDGYLYVTCRAIASRVNDNSDGFVSSELEAHHDTFTGCPHFIEHDNANWRKARGVVVAEKFHSNEAPKELLDSQSNRFESEQKYNPIIWTPEEHRELYATHNEELAVDLRRDDWVELLIEVDAQRFPVYAQALLEKKISTFSMGCDVAYSRCSVGGCDNVATMPSEYCTHIATKKGQWLSATAGAPKIWVYEDNRDISFFEISAVRSPADASATLIELNSCLQSAACNIQMLGSTLRILGEGFLDEPDIPKAVTYELLSEVHKSTLDQERIAQLLDEILERL